MGNGEFQVINKCENRKKVVILPSKRMEYKIQHIVEEHIVEVHIVEEHIVAYVF